MGILEAQARISTRSASTRRVHRGPSHAFGGIQSCRTRCPLPRNSTVWCGSSTAIPSRTLFYATGL